MDIEKEARRRADMEEKFREKSRMLSELQGAMERVERREDIAAGIRMAIPLRYYFAAAALTGMLANPNWNVLSTEDVIALAIQAADAMLIVREKKEDQEETWR